MSQSRIHSAGLVPTLRSCPFCGSDAELWQGGGQWRVHCHGCEISKGPHATREKAAYHWNKRRPELVAMDPLDIEELFDQAAGADEETHMSEAVRPALGHKKHISDIEFWARADHGLRGDELREAAAFIAKQNAEIEQLYSAVVWALGAGDGFPARRIGAGLYWWREELASRAGMKWDGSFRGSLA